MALQPGTTLGPYQIQSLLGAGGMGEVYRARDTRLDRAVAIKILPQEMSSDPLRKQRFEREAKTISSLNHPNICVLHAVGSQDGLSYLVMECLEGETLAKRLEKGPLPLEQVLKYGAQIADALDKAHRSGVVHRDLKPGNIMLTPAGAKLMDFGLAKPAVTLATAATLTATTPSSPVTEQGTIVGTFQYMSPEQVEGKELDGRSDTFSLGAVLYEMVTGKRAFEGKSQLSVASAILEKEPAPINAVKPLTPISLERIIRKCLAKDADERWQSAGDLASELRWVSEFGSQTTATVTEHAHKKLVILLMVGLLTLGLVAGAIWWFGRGNGRVSIPMALEIVPPQGGRVYRLAISPDGRQLALAVGVGPSGQLWVRDMNSHTFRRLQGLDEPDQMFWSANSQSLGVFAAGKLLRVDVATGRVQTVISNTGGTGGDWNANDEIVFNPQFNAGLLRVSALGGDVKPLTHLDKAKHETIHAYPHFLPDSKHLIFLNRGGPGDVNYMCLASLDSDEIVQLTEADGVLGYAEPGYLLWIHQGAIKAQTFDTRKLKFIGKPFVVVDKVGYQADLGYAIASVSRIGPLVYEEEAYEERQFAIMDRTGHEVRKLGTPALYGGFRVSRDGARIAADRKDPSNGASDLWIGDIERGTFTRLTNTPWNEVFPVWSPDGAKVIFASDRNGLYDLYQRMANGAGEDVELFRSGADKTPMSVSPDGKNLVYQEANESGSLPVAWRLALSGEKAPERLEGLQDDKGVQDDTVVSPDGRWVSYSSTESGRSEIYITSFQETGGRTLVSSQGGLSPRWSSDGKRLFYISSDGQLMEAVVKSGNKAEVGIVKALFATKEIFDVVGEGKYFVFLRTVSTGAPHAVSVMLNWDSEMKKQ